MSVLNIDSMRRQIDNHSFLGEDNVLLKVFANNMFSGSIIPLSTLCLSQYDETFKKINDKIIVFVFSKDDTNALLNEQNLEIYFDLESYIYHLGSFTVDKCNLVTPPVGTNTSLLIIDLLNNHVEITNNRADMVHLIDKIKSYWW